MLRVNASAPAFHLALLHGDAGNLDQAYRHLDAAIARRDKRFGERLQAMGLAAAADRHSASGN